MTVQLAMLAAPAGPHLADVPAEAQRPRLPLVGAPWERMPARAGERYQGAPEVLAAHVWRHTVHRELRATSMLWQTEARLQHALLVWMQGDRPRALPPTWATQAAVDFGVAAARRAQSPACWAWLQPFRAQQVSPVQVQAAEPPLLDPTLLAILRSTP